VDNCRKIQRNEMDDKKMNIDTLIKLEQSDNERLRGIAKLAIILDMKYKDTEKLVDKMKKQLETPHSTKKQYEVAMDAEFSC
jgi:hypothetical protein